MTVTVHAFQWVAVFAAAVLLTSRWLLSRPTSRWRHILGGMVSTILWIPVAYQSNNVGVASGGEIVTFGSGAIGGVATFMIVVCIAGLLVGLVLWVEETVDEAHDSLPEEMQHRRGRE